MNEFFDAVETGDLAKVRSLLAENPSLVAATDTRPRKPSNLIGAPNMRMLSAGSPKSPPKPTVASTRTALHVAVVGRQIEVARLLIAHGAEVNARDNSQCTPLHFAVRRPVSVELVELLIASGAEIDARDASGHTALHSAVRNEGALAVVEFLLAHGAEVSVQSGDGWTPLSTAVCFPKSDQIAVLELLIRHGGDVNVARQAQPWNGSMLCAAIRGGKPEITHLLIEAGADVNAHPEGAETALHVVASRGLDKHVELLLAAGADAHALDGENRTPVDLLNGHVEMISMLEQYAAGEMKR